MKTLFLRRRLLGLARDRLLQWVSAFWVLEAVGCSDEQAAADGVNLDSGESEQDAGRLETLAGPRFDHGVASGDPLSNGVILWSRVSGLSLGSAPISWQVAVDEAFSNIVAEGEASADAAHDYTVKVDVRGLLPATAYYFRFKAGSAESPRGRTRTLPVGEVERVRLAVVSCSCMMSGYFNAFAEIAESNVDAVVHLGDYIYEYGTESSFYAQELDRAPQPPHEAVSLDDYRARYAQYRTDPDLIAMHAAHPMIPMWDDHEVADDVWNGGAFNHSEDEGDFATRRAAALQAYAEWMPVREKLRDDHVSLYGRWAFGDLVDLLMVDTRIEDRDVGNTTTPATDEHTNLGEAQERWLHEQLTASKARGTAWRLLASQVMMSQLDVPDFYLDLQAWDGYPAVRERLFDVIEDQQIDNIVVLSADSHLAAAMEVARDPFGTSYDPATGAGALMSELMAPSVTAPAGARFRAAKGPEVVAATHPHFKYLDNQVHGYLLVEIERGRVDASWHASETLLEPNTTHAVVKRFRIETGDPRLVP